MPVAASQPVAGLLLPVAGPARVIQVGAKAVPGGSCWPVRWVDTIDGDQVAWCGERRNLVALPVNASAWMLAARLGCADLADRIGLNGDLLLAGIDRDGRAADAPDAVMQAAHRAGLHHRPVGCCRRRRRDRHRAQRRPDTPHGLDHGTVGAHLPPRVVGSDADLEPTAPAARVTPVRGVLQPAPPAPGHRRCPTPRAAA
jgi:hypothetical protein